MKPQARLPRHGNSTKASIATLLAGAGEDKFIVHIEGLEPWRYAGFLVNMPAEMIHCARLGRGHRKGELVLAGALELDVVAVMRAIVRDHGHQIALDDLVAPC